MAQNRLTPAQKAKVEKLYRKGLPPREIAAEVGATATQITRFVYKRGLSQQRTEIKERVEAIKTETAMQMLERIRAQTQADMEPVALAIADSLKIDAQKLIDGWELVQNAGDAASLMRAKKSHQERFFGFIGLPQTAQTPEPQKPVNIFLGTLPRVGDPPAPVDVTPRPEDGNTQSAQGE